MTRNLENYVPVSERIRAFYEQYPEGVLRSEIMVDDGTRVLIRATAYRHAEDDLPGVGHAEEVRGAGPVNKTSAVENCETSAWGRAIAALGFEVQHGIATREEVENAQAQQAASAAPGTNGSDALSSPGAADAAGIGANADAPRGGTGTAASPESDVTTLQDLIDLQPEPLRGTTNAWVNSKGGMAKLTDEQKRNLWNRLAREPR